VNPWCAYHQDTRLPLRPGLRRRVAALSGRNIPAGCSRAAARPDLFAYFENLRIRALRSKWIRRFSKLTQYFELSLPIIPGFVSVHIDAVIADTLGQLE